MEENTIDTSENVAVTPLSALSSADPSSTLVVPDFVSLILFQKSFTLFCFKFVQDKLCG
jgi:hypothetical protein